MKRTNNIHLILVLVAVLHALVINATLQVQLHSKHPKMLDTTITHRYPLTSPDGLKYMGTIQLGTPPQKLEVAFDTSSNELWVPTKGCKSTGGRCATSTNLYDPSLSTTARITEDVFRLRNGFVEVDGKYVEDILTIGEGETSLKMKRNVRFGSATNMNDDSGSLGLGFAKKGATGKHIVEQMHEDGLLPRALFTYYMKYCNLDEECENAGQLTFGAEDREHCNEVLTRVPVLEDSVNWAFRMEKVELRLKETETVTLTETPLINKINGITNTDLPVIMAPLHDFNLLEKHLNLHHIADRTYLLPCNTRFELIVNVNGVRIPINNEHLLKPFDEHDTNNCRLTIIPGTDNNWLLGAPFVQANCLVHDYTNRQLGIAPVRH